MPSSIYTSSRSRTELSSARSNPIPVAHLFENASDAASSVDKINIIISHKNNFLQILISNDGAQNIVDCNSLFERGYTTKKNGNGFGLDLCLTIAELHKGRITTRKINKDEIEFKVELPICA